MSNYPVPSVSEQGQYPQINSRFPASLTVALWSLVGLTLCVIVALFAGDIPYRGERIFATVIYFTAFVALTIFDMSRARQSPLFPTELAVGSNIFILAFGLLTAWIVYIPSSFYQDAYTSNSHYETAIMWFIPLVVTVKAVVYCGYALRKLSLANLKELTPLVNATIALSAIAVAGIHLTTVFASSFGIETNDVFWKIIISLLMLVALGVSSSFLIAWYTRFNDPVYQEAKRAISAQQRAYAKPSVYPQPQREYTPSSAPAPLQEWPADANGYAVPVLQDGSPDLRYAWFNQTPTPPAQNFEYAPKQPVTYQPEPVAPVSVEKTSPEPEAEQSTLPQVNLLPEDHVSSEKGE